MQWEMILYTASTWVLPVLCAITQRSRTRRCCHRLGDDAAYGLRRVSFNPLRP
jgi:hypothetical protein